MHPFISKKTYISYLMTTYLQLCCVFRNPAIFLELYTILLQNILPQKEELLMNIVKYKIINTIPIFIIANQATCKSKICDLNKAF